MNSINVSKLKFQGSRGPEGEDGEIGKPGATVCKTKYLSRDRCQKILDVRFVSMDDKFIGLAYKIGNDKTTRP